MLHTRRSLLLTGLALCLTVSLSSAASPKPEKSITGTPELQSINVVRFGPEGVLFIGDGKGSQVIAVETTGAAGKAGFKEAIEGIDKKIADRVGAMPKDIEIIDLAVNPVTHVAVVAVRNKGKAMLLTVDGEGKIGELPLENVKYAQLQLPKGKVTGLTDVPWAGDRLLVAGKMNDQFASKLFTIMYPLTHEAKATVTSTETFHVAHGNWETRAPMTVLMPYEEDGKKYLAGSFACTPVVKYPLDEVKPDGKVKGVSMIEMGSGNQPLNMFSYEKDGKSYVLMNTKRFHHSRAPVGPSQYWAVKFERSLLQGGDNSRSIGGRCCRRSRSLSRRRRRRWG